MAPPRRALLVLAALLLSLSLGAASFHSDELLLNDDEEFEGVVAPPSAPSPPAAPVVSSSRRRSADAPLPGSGESNAVQFTLEHDLGDGKGFVSAGTFSARLKTFAHGTQVGPSLSLVTISVVWLVRLYSWPGYALVNGSGMASSRLVLDRDFGGLNIIRRCSAPVSFVELFGRNR
jgi:hypothetical protein